MALGNKPVTLWTWRTGPSGQWCVCQAETRGAWPASSALSVLSQGFSPVIKGKWVLMNIVSCIIAILSYKLVSQEQNGFRKGRRTRDQIAHICWIIEKAREFQKNICFIDYTKVFNCVDHNHLWKILKEMGIPGPPYLSPEKPVCGSRSNS